MTKGLGFPRPLTIDDYAANGLDSGFAYSSSKGFSGSPASVITDQFGNHPFTPDTFAAFGGVNPNLGVGEFNMPIGRSVYNGLQSSYKQQLRDPFRGVNSMDLTISYTYSRFQGTGGNDQNFSPLALDFRDPTGFFGDYRAGPHESVQVRRHLQRGASWTTVQRDRQLCIRTADDDDRCLPGRATGNGRNLPQRPYGRRNRGRYLPSTRRNRRAARTIPTLGELVELTQAISNWNTNQAGQPTPAGQALIDGGFMTLSDLQALGGVKQILALPPETKLATACTKKSAWFSAGRSSSRSVLRSSRPSVPSTCSTLRTSAC